MSPKTFWRELQPILAYQWNYLLLCIAWNVAGIILRANGEAALGPSASLTAVMVSALFMLVLGLGAWRWPLVYALGSCLLLFQASSAVIPAYTQDPNLWPSDYWRWGGALLNGIGSLLCAMGLLRWWKYQKVAS
ncbi:MAG: hypothetical protein OIF38_09400 [Cellvibrionaceae bacterium]|nr:hypothetical protein [Cellvibrionaceae bacterium]